MRKLYILTDIDHTIFDATWRDYMIGGDWDEYHKAGEKDLPHSDIIELICHLDHIGYIVVGITAIPEKFRQLTMERLLKYKVPMDELLMRADDDRGKSPEVKVKLAVGRFGDQIKEDVLFIMDDREDVIAAFKGLGITALQVHAAREEAHV